MGGGAWLFLIQGVVTPMEKAAGPCSIDFKLKTILEHIQIIETLLQGYIRR